VDQHVGLSLMLAEMARQRADALASMLAGPVAAEIATHARRTGRLMLYGMGGSHHVNRAVEPLYRDAGLECLAMPASEALMSPPPPAARVALFVSQSGESGEIVDLLARPAGEDWRCGMTLDPGSTLARSVRSAIIGHGGAETAFAATRSILVTLAMHAAILEALGSDQAALRAVLETENPVDIAAVDAALAPCDVVVFAGRHVMQGIAASGALSMMELCRIPTIGFEAGQFRHGPFEFLRPGVGVILLRGAGPDRDHIPPIAAATVAAGCQTVVIDASGTDMTGDCIRLPLRANAGLAAAADMLLCFQRLNIAVARRRVQGGIGTPLRTSKVTV
jgi:fructoselysine-6-P-deglycase FrlB-like protein